MARRTKGTGTIRQRRPGVWEVRAPNPGGKPPQISRTVNGNERAAERRLRQLHADIDRGKYLDTEVTVGDALERWLRMAGPDFSPTTVATYRRYMKNRILPALGSKPLHRLSAAHLNDLYTDLREEGLAPSSIRQVHSIISRALRVAELEGTIVDNPCRRATLPKVRRPDLAIPEPAEFAAIVREALRSRHREMAVFFWVAAAIGARRGELCALRWTDLDVATSTLTIARSVAELEGGGLLEKDTKTHAIRTLKVDPGTLALLVDHRGRMEQRARLGDTELRADAFMFTYSLTGARPWTPDHATGTFAAIRDRLGLAKELRLHSLRHFSTSQGLAGGIDIRTISGRHGWADATMPLNRYGHFLATRDGDAADVIAGVLGPPPGELLSPDAQKPPHALPGGDPEEHGADDAGVGGEDD